MDRTILCFGDSNTYGYDPRSYLGDRYPRAVRWTGILDSRPGWHAENWGQNGRSIPCRPGGLAQLRRQLESREAPDVLAVMLGSNDLLQSPGFTAGDTAARMEAFLRQLLLFPVFSEGRGRLLLICPPAMRPGTWVREDRLLAESAALGELYGALAQQLGISFADARAWNVPLLSDGVHFSPEGHRTFAREMTPVLERLLS